MVLLIDIVDDGGVEDLIPGGVEVLGSDKLEFNDHIPLTEEIRQGLLARAPKGTDLVVVTPADMQPGSEFEFVRDVLFLSRSKDVDHVALPNGFASSHWDGLHSGLENPYGNQKWT